MKCDFKLWQKPVPEPCPACGAKFLVFGGGKKNPVLMCMTENCGFKKPIEESSLAQPAPEGVALVPPPESAAPPAS